MHTASNWRNQARERCLSGFSREVFNSSGEIVTERSVDGVHWIETPEAANTVLQALTIHDQDEEKDAA